MDTEPKPRDHRDEHEGCTAMWPWLPGCPRYWRVEALIAAATEDVKLLSQEDRDYWMQAVIAGRTLRGYPSKWQLRGDYISMRERWQEDEWDLNLESTASLARRLPNWLGGLTVEEKAQQRWDLNVRRRALEVLVKYGATIPPVSA